MNDGDSIKQLLMLDNMSENFYGTEVYLYITNSFKKKIGEFCSVMFNVTMNYLKCGEQTLLTSFFF